MSIRILQTLIVCLFLYQGCVGTPYELIRPGCFDPMYDTHPQWFDFPWERMEALKECTQSGTSIGFFNKPGQDRASTLWNSRWDNRVVRLEKKIFYGDCIGQEIMPNWEMRDFPYKTTDYLYLRPGLDNGIIAAVITHPDEVRVVYQDGWGVLCEVY